jgi:hypothetical protein
MTASWIAPGLAPTYSHGAITHGPEPQSIRKSPTRAAM